MPRVKPNTKKRKPVERRTANAGVRSSRRITSLDDQFVSVLSKEAAARLAAAGITL